jgi:WD40 repeat protein
MSQRQSVVLIAVLFVLGVVLVVVGTRFAALPRRTEAPAAPPIDPGKAIVPVMGSLRHCGTVDFMVFSCDGRVLASRARAGAVKLWNATTGKCTGILPAGDGARWALAFSPDGRTLASGGADCKVSLWRVPDGTLKRALQGHKEKTRFVTFSPDGETLASASANGEIKLWDARIGRNLSTWTGPDRDWDTSLAFSPDGKVLAVGGRAEQLALLETITGNITTLSEYGDTEYDSARVIFSPDGRWLAQGGPAPCG